MLIVFSVVYVGFWSFGIVGEGINERVVGVWSV